MTITKDEFNNMMRVTDILSQKMEDCAGIVNAIMDGEDPQQFELTPEEADIACDNIYAYQLSAAKYLGVKIDFLLDILSSACTNRWEAYCYLKGDL